MLPATIHITPNHPDYAAIVASITPIGRVHNYSNQRTQLTADMGPRAVSRHENINELRG